MSFGILRDGHKSYEHLIMSIIIGRFESDVGRHEEKKKRFTSKICSASFMLRSRAKYFR